MHELQWPAREYVVQVARFDPSKGIPNVIDSYAKFRKLLVGKVKDTNFPQLLVCGHGAVDDPDASIIYDQVIALINSEKYREYANDIVVMRIPPSDQRKLGGTQFFILKNELNGSLFCSAQCFDGQFPYCTPTVYP